MNDENRESASIAFDPIKSRAGELFKSQYGLCIGAILISAALPMLMTAQPLAASLSMLREVSGGVMPSLDVMQRTNGNLTLTRILVEPISLIFQVGIVKVFLAIYRGEETSVSDVFWGFRNLQRILIGMLPLFGMTLLSTIASNSPSLFSSVLSIAGMVISIGLWMIPYILVDSQDLPPIDAVRLSWRMTIGHRWEYFLFCLSFIGWVLLSIVTLGIGLLYYMPYWQASLAGYYEEVRQNALYEGRVTSMELE